MNKDILFYCLIGILIILGTVIWYELGYQNGYDNRINSSHINLSEVTFVSNDNFSTYCAGVVSKNGALIQSDDVRIEGLNNLIKFYYAIKWTNYIYCSNNRYFIDGIEVFLERHSEPTYEYLFNRVDSSPSNIVRVDYHNKTYLVLPLLIENCSSDDAITITQDCESGDYFKWEENEYRIWKENE